MIGCTLTFEHSKGTSKGVCVGEYVGAIPANGGYISGTIYHVQVNGELHHVRAGFVREIMPFNEEDFAEMEQIKLHVRKVLEEYFTENLRFLKDGARGYLNFSLPSVKKDEMPGYIRDIAHEIADRLEENL